VVPLLSGQLLSERRDGKVICHRGDGISIQGQYRDNPYDLIRFSESQLVGEKLKSNELPHVHETDFVNTVPAQYRELGEGDYAERITTEHQVSYCEGDDGWDHPQEGYAYMGRQYGHILFVEPNFRARRRIQAPEPVVEADPEFPTVGSKLRFTKAGFDLCEDSFGNPIPVGFEVAVTKSEPRNSYLQTTGSVSGQTFGFSGNWREGLELVTVDPVSGVTVLPKLGQKLRFKCDDPQNNDGPSGTIVEVLSIGAHHFRTDDNGFFTGNWQDCLELVDEAPADERKPSGVEARVCEDIARRQRTGMDKYGTTVEDNPLELRQWLNHAYEECLDQAVYLKRAIEILTGKEPS